MKITLKPGSKWKLRNGNTVIMGNNGDMGYMVDPDTGKKYALTFNDEGECIEKEEINREGVVIGLEEYDLMERLTGLDHPNHETT